MAVSEGTAATGRGLSPLRQRLKLAYAAGSLFDGIVTQGTGIFLFFYVTAVCGLPGALAGLALSAGLVVDALVDPLLGSLSDGLRSHWGRRLPLMAVGLPATIVFFILIFSLPVGWSSGALALYLAALSIGLRVSMSLFLLPYLAVGAELSDDYRERSSIMAWRWGVAMLGALLAILLGFGVFLSGPGGLARRAGYTPLALVLAVLIALGGTIAMRGLWAMRDRQHAPAAAVGTLHSRLIGELREIFRNPSFRALFAGAILLFTSLAVQSSLALHANTWFWRLSSQQIQTVTLALFGGLLLGAPLASPLLKRLEKRIVLLIGMLGLAAAFAVPVGLRLAGLLPLTGNALVAVLAASVLTGGILMAAAAIAFASMMADAADEHEHLFGARREGLYFAGWAFASKAAAGFGQLIAGVALQLIGFPAGGTRPAGAAMPMLPPHTIEWLALLYGPGAGLLAIAAAATCLFYRLDAARHAAILADLDLRRAVVAVPL